MNPQKRFSATRRRAKGQAILEVLATTIVIMIPLAYLSVDVAAVLFGYSESVHVARDAARAAASHTNAADAQMAADFRMSMVKASNVISSLTMTGFDFIPDESVDVKTLVDIKLPAPIPKLTEVTLKAHALVPIVSSAAHI